MPKKKVEIAEEVVEETVSIQSPKGPTELEKLYALYKDLKDRGINSIGDLENLIAREARK